MVTKNKKNIQWILVFLIVVAAGGLLMFSKLETNSESLPEMGISVPNGWYLHPINKNYTLLTRQQNLPNVDSTEGWAYGEQISINRIIMDRPLEEWIALNTADDALAQSKTWNSLKGRKLLRVEHEVGAAGKALSYYLFDHDVVLIFMLYPLESYNSVTGKWVRNDGNIDLLEQILKDYAAKL